MGARRRVGGGAEAFIAESLEAITPGMFAASYALIGCLVGGILSVGGVLLGVRMGRRFRELPRVKCLAPNWELTFQKRLATCTFEVDLFNEGQLATGLRGVSVALRDGGEGEEEAVVIGRLKDSASKEPLWAIDLPAQRWAHANAYAAFDGKDARRLSGFRGANLLGQFPDGRGFDIALVRSRIFLCPQRRSSRDVRSAWRRGISPPAFGGAEDRPVEARKRKVPQRIRTSRDDIATPQTFDLEQVPH